MDEEAVIAAVRAALRSQAPEQAQGLRVVQLYELYKTAHRSRRSWAVINDRLEPVVRFLADREVMGLRVVDWSEYRAQREQQEIPTGKSGRRYKAHTINTELTWIKAMINWGVLQGRVPYNPILAAKPVKTKSKRSTAPMERDVSALLKDADDRMRFVILCAADGMMRRSEAVRMQHDWVDRDNRCIHLPGWACKSGRARDVPMTRRLLEAIDALPRHIRSPYVLVSPRTGGPYNLDHVSRWFRHIADAAGVTAAPGDRRVVLHDVRRGAATNSTRRGVRIDVVSRILGHASLDQTKQYVEVADLDMEIALAQIEAGIDRERNR